MEDAGSKVTVHALQHGALKPSMPRLKQVSEILGRGVGHAHRALDVGRVGQARRADLKWRQTSTEGWAVASANGINGLAKLRAFKEMQELVCRALVGVGS